MEAWMLAAGIGDRLGARDFVRTVFNADYREGGDVGMHVGLSALDDGGAL